MPYKDDTDDDGLKDDMEITTEGTNPTDFDTDRDYLPDGYIEGWRRRNETSWKAIFCSFANNTRAPWEGEDLDCDGVKDSTESSPTDSDSDNDGI